MPYRLPPLKAMQVFEAAARHLSFKEAADELCLSPSAVSRQIQSLEDWLGVPLFQRLHRTVALTEAGQELAREAGSAFSGLRRTVERLSSDGRRLRLSVAPVFAARWLLPRLGELTARHPELTVEIVANNPHGDDVAPLQAHQADAGILHGCGERWADFETLRLMPPTSFVPVCAPGLLPDSQPLQRLEQLAAYPWLINQLTPWVWGWYLQQLGAPGLAPAQKIGCDAFPIYEQSLLQGRGISVAPIQFAGPLLRQGRLVVAYQQWLEHPSYNYYLVWSDRNRSKPALAQFRSWLETQVAASWRDYRV